MRWLSCIGPSCIGNQPPVDDNILNIVNSKMTQLQAESSLEAITIPDDLSLSNESETQMKKCVYPSIYENHFSRLLISNDQIQERNAQIAQLINNHYPINEPLVLLCVLKGSSIFYHDLIIELRKCKHPFIMEFVRVQSYEGTQSNGEPLLTIPEKVLSSLKNRNVILVEDIIDTGKTLDVLIPVLMNKGQPKSFEVCSLLDKRLESNTFKTGIKAKYVGFSIPNLFVVGYGLDYEEMYRDLMDIWVLDEKGIKEGGWKL